FFQAEDGIRDPLVTGVQTCALPISTICIGVLRTFDRLCSGLTEIGTPILWVPARMASSAPRRFGASVAILRSGSVRANATTSARSEERRVGKAWRYVGAREP